MLRKKKNPSNNANATKKKKIRSNWGDWTRRESNTQPSDLESDALPLRHGSYVIMSLQ